ncbi:MAG: addiction module protein [Bacteroidetes bacterium]|nr:addiction module protein [Bacteroidota bacterium]
MVKDIKDIVDSAMALSVNSRAYLAEMLLESLDFEEDFIIEKEWKKEITRRCSEIDGGKVKLVPGEEGFEKLRNTEYQ